MTAFLQSGRFGGPPDPHYASVILLTEFEGTDGQQGSFPDLKSGRIITITNPSRIEADRSRYGSTSLLTNTGTCSLVDSIDWQLSAANSDAFTLEYSVLQGTLVFQWDVFYQFGAAGSRSWLIRHHDTGEVTFFWSTDGTALSSLATSGAGLQTPVDTWDDICIEKNTSGKLRIYINGVMKGSSTPANSAFFNAAQILEIGLQGNNNAYVDHVRFTKGVARYDSDGGYTPDVGFFPTS